jgi:hypothetical protein
MSALIKGNGFTDIGTSGNPWTAGYFTDLQRGGVDVATEDDARFPSADQKAALAGSSGTPGSGNKFLTQADRSRVWFLEGVTGLTGGGGTKLDGVSTTGVNVDLVVVLIDGSTRRFYQLVAGTDAESSPNVIRPDDYNGVSNAKVWKLRDVDTDGDDLAIAYSAANYTPAAATVAGHFEGMDDVLADVLTTRTGVYRTLTKTAHEMIANTGTPTIGSITFGSIKLQCAQFTNAATMSALVAFRLPDEWDDSVPLKFKLEWSGDTTNTGDVCFEVKAGLFEDADDLTAALGTAHKFNDSFVTIKYLQLTAGFAPTPSGSGRLCVLDIQRTYNDATDTYTGVCYLTAVHCQYAESETEPAAW